jgi:hypothetical protein
MGEHRYLYPVGKSLEHAVQAALEPSFDRVLLRQPAPVSVEVNLLSFQLLQEGTKKPATCKLTIQVEVKDGQGRRLEKGTFSASASGAFDGRSNPEAVWRASYDVADQFKNWLAGSPAVANAVERSRYQTAVSGPPAVSSSPPPRQPVASKRYKPGYSRKVAAVIGINDYGVWPSLEGATPDAKRIAESLRGMGFGVTEVYDGEATRERILQLLGEELQEQTDDESIAMIFFAGHGYTETLPNGEKRGYIIPVDGDSDRVFSTGISMETLRDLSNRLPAKHVYYAMDSCYSGLGFTRGMGPRPSTENFIDIVTSRRAVQMMTAGQEGEQALEQGGRGIFTSFLVRALDGEADFNGDGYVTASEIGAFVPSNVSSATKARQNPRHGTLEGSGEVVFPLE